MSDMVISAAHGAGAPAVHPPDPCVLTIFGASGDLTRRKLIPALYALHIQKLLPEPFAVVGFARREGDDDSFRAAALEALRQSGHAVADAAEAQAFCRRLHYYRGDMEGPLEMWRAYAAWLETRRFPPNRLCYFAVRPDQFGPLAARLGACGLARPGAGWLRVVVEKPFGADEAGARALNRQLHDVLDESQIYRIDHYLGKETVQNILSFRFANAIFEPVFNSQYVEHIQITAAEDIGVEQGRAGYYESAGALRDVLQNHLLQLLCLVTMDPPADLTADAIRNEKLKIMQAIRPPAAGAEPARSAVRGQYAAGTVKGTPARGYREEERVSPASQTETYAAVRLDIHNWRWSGLPVFLRAGKRMARRATEIVVRFKRPPLELFETVECEGDRCNLSQSSPNRLIFRIQPQEGIALRFSAKRPVMGMAVEDVEMDFSYSNTWRRELPEAYERLLLDVMRGDATLFTRADEIEAAWRIVDPIRRLWQDAGRYPLHPYPAGSWGPAAAGALLAPLGAVWHDA